MGNNPSKTIAITQSPDSPMWIEPSSEKFKENLKALIKVLEEMKKKKKLKKKFEVVE
jgi:hypothetical protein